MNLKIYLKVRPFEKQLVTLALESGADGVFVDADHLESVNRLGRTQALTPGDLTELSLQGKASEEQAAEVLKKGGVVLLEQGWEIIPVENLLALENGELGLEVASLEQARLAGTILERGVDFLVVRGEAREVLKTMVQELKFSQAEENLESAEIVGIEPAGLGHRVCVDTCSLLERGQGLLVGNAAEFMFLVHAETETNPYVAARPFRINAGPVHAYVQKGGDRTSYLEELRSGDDVLLVNDRGRTSLVTVGRVKIEIRPLLKLTARIGENEGQIFLQNAETIRLVKPDGTPVSVVALQVGDEVLCRRDRAGRHFGMRIKEAIQER